MDSEKFNKLPLAKKARVVAYDVTQQIKFNPLMQSAHAGYVHPVRILNNVEDLSGDHESCQVCAKGSMMYSYLKLSKDSSVFEGNAEYYSNVSDWKQGRRVSQSQTIKYFGASWDTIEHIYESLTMEEGFGDNHGFFHTSSNNLEVTEDQVVNFRNYCNRIRSNKRGIDDVVITQMMRNYLLNNKIDLTNHPHPDEEIHYDETSGSVVVCDTYDTLTF